MNNKIKIITIGLIFIALSIAFLNLTFFNPEKIQENREKIFSELEERIPKLIYEKLNSVAEKKAVNELEEKIIESNNADKQWIKERLQEKPTVEKLLALFSLTESVMGINNKLLVQGFNAEDLIEEANSLKELKIEKKIKFNLEEKTLDLSGIKQEELNTEETNLFREFLNLRKKNFENAENELEKSIEAKKLIELNALIQVKQGS